MHNTIIKENSIWVDSKNKKFKVKRVTTGIVYYYNTATEEQFNCLEDAFADRFVEITNQG